MSGEASSSPTRLLLADDHDLVREGMRAMLSKEPDLEVVGEAENGREAVELCRRLRPDLVLMDVRMPQMDGLEATREIKREHPRTIVLMVTTHENPDYMLEAIKAGAAGYILKDATKQRLMNAVRRVLQGESPLNQELAMRLIQHLADEADRRTEEPLPEQQEKPPPQPLAEPLAGRELDVLRLLVQGKTNREVAQTLWLSLSTVKTHIHRIISKLDVSDRTQAAVRAVELGLFDDQEKE